MDMRTYASRYSVDVARFDRMPSDAQEQRPAALPDDWWTAEDCACFLGISPATWRAYVARGQAPQPARRFGRTNVWRPPVVREWNASRRGQGWRSSQGDT